MKKKKIEKQNEKLNPTWYSRLYDLIRITSVRFLRGSFHPWSFAAIYNHVPRDVFTLEGLSSRLGPRDFDDRGQYRHE